MKPKIRLFAVGAVTVIVILLSALIFYKGYAGGDQKNKENKGEKGMASKYRRLSRAPEFMLDADWLNTDKPISMSSLRGKVVLLDFWTYCCINCMHVIPDLKKLEKKYANELVVIGVHSAKFTNERESANIKQAILRYEIEHPVINDGGFRIWRTYGVRAWPTLVVIDTEGYVIGAISGEGNYEILDQVIGDLIAEAQQNGTLNSQPLELSLEKFEATKSLLSFPGKVIIDSESKRLFISDSNYNRIVVANLNGTVIDVVGNGEIGSSDGGFESANFFHPQGMYLNGDMLYIADTENHLIRKCDLKSRKVETLAGTGKQARQFNIAGDALNTPLNSPWDLILINEKLYIAMAGPHQIWTLDLRSKKVEPYAGSGREGRIDGSLKESALAQPSGITSDGHRLYVADSEVSSIRYVDLEPKSRVGTVVGLDLFEFGDVDGQGDEVRLQHPLGVHFYAGKIYVADTYNHKIKIVDPEKRTSQTFLGAGKPGFKDGLGESAEFYEPSGLWIYEGKLYIADTNNHAIRVADLKTREIKTLQLTNLGVPMVDELLPNAEKLSLSVKKLSPNSPGELLIFVKLPEGYKLNPGSPVSYEIKLDKDKPHLLSFRDSDLKGNVIEPKFPLRLPFKTSSTEGSSDLNVEATLLYCKTDGSVCLVKSLVWKVPVQVEKNGSDTMLVLDYKLTP